jgi:hypothetical protein
MKLFNRIFKVKIRFFIQALLLTGSLLIFFTSCTKEEKPAPKLEIGQDYEGGIIFYLDDSGQHGLICASYDQSSALPWSNGVNSITNVTGSDIGTGKANTEAIVAAQGAGNYAAQICNDLDINGYHDWYLPSKSECFTMYFNLKTMKKIGHFTDAIYWSSTEASLNNAYSQYSNDGYPPNGGYYKNTPQFVRAIRSF